MLPECIITGIFTFVIGLLMGIALETRVTEDTLNKTNRGK